MKPEAISRRDAALPADGNYNISGERTAPPNANAPAAARRQRLPLGTLPAISFEVVKP